MPLPSPRSGESRGDFVGRCVEVLTDKGEFDDNEQRVAVCISRWEEGSATTNKERAMNLTALESLTVNLKKVRSVTMDGEEYLVAPVVALIEGVHAGSDGPMLYESDVLEAYVGTWNGVPVVVHHPKGEDGVHVSANSPEVIEKCGVGYLWNVVFDDERKLRGEVWVHKAKCGKKHPDVLASLESPEAQLEVSTGLFSGVKQVSGTWNGEEYDYLVTDIRPDHLALLPGGKGACSWEDGCGIRVNEEKGGDNVEKGVGMGILERLRALSGGISNILGGPAGGMALQALEEMSYSEKEMAVRRALEKLDHRESGVTESSTPDGVKRDVVSHWLVELFDNKVIYEKHGTDDPSMYRRSYSIDDSGEVFFGDDVQEVRLVRKYVPVEDMTRNEKGSCNCLTVKARKAKESFRAVTK